MMRLNAASKMPLLAAAFAATGLMSGCEEVKKCVEEQFSCVEDGVAEGNANISGVVEVDGFFEQVINFQATAGKVSAGIETELDGIRSDFGLEADADVAAGLKAKFDANLEGGLQVRVEPPRCEIRADVALDASLECQASAGCSAEVDPGELTVECSGRCEVDVEAMAMVECGAEATLQCEVTAPMFACTGKCEGTCTLEADAEVDCHGACEGACDGTCEGSLGEGGICNGTCHGSCSGGCVIEADVAVDCAGTCDGKCTYEPGEASCEADAKVYCDASASVDASVECNGSCDGNFEPPSVDVECEAEASCNAQAKAKAELDVECSPASVDIVYAFKADVDAEARAELKYAIGNLRTRLGQVAAATKKANLVLKAGEGVVGAAGTAFEGIVDAAAEGELSSSAAYRLATCVPGELDDVGAIVDSSSKELKAKMDAAVAVQEVAGM